MPVIQNQSKLENIRNWVGKSIKDRLGRTILGPLNEMVDEQITDITTTIGSFIIRSVRGKLERSISFTIGGNYMDAWMEEALHGILYKYNNIKRDANLLELGNAPGYKAGSALYYRLGSGTHSLKYRQHKILLNIQNITPSSATGRITKQRIYTVITYDMSPDFVLNFEKDMILHRNSLLKIKTDSPKINTYKDYHEGDGYTYWEQAPSIYKRRLGTLYLPRETKLLLVNTINTFFASKELYNKQGIAHNLKILLHGPHGSGKDTAAKTIASEWNRNIYYITGGKGGRFIPNAIQSDHDCVIHPLFLISDIDKYPFLIHDTKVELDSTENNKEDKIGYKHAFNQMINALDGIMSAENRIIVMTTNHIEKFSPVFTRPGRIDLILEIGYVTPEVFRKYTYDHYQRILPKNIELKRSNLTIADLQFDFVFLKLNADEFITKYCK